MSVGIHQQYFILSSESVQNEELIYNEFGGDILLKRLTDTRDKLFELFARLKQNIGMMPTI